MDKFEMIKQFKDLLDNGVITQEEFDQKKKELLSIGDDIQVQAEEKPVVEVSADEVPATEESVNNDSTIEEKADSEDLAEAEEPTETAEVVKPTEPVEATEPTDAVVTTETEPQMETPVPGQQAAASKKGKIIIGVVVAVVVLLFIGILGSGGSSGIKGSWNCYSVTYLGETMTASDAQVDDYTFKFTSNTFDANIYGAEVSGTYEYTKTVTLNDGSEADVYTLTTDSGAELTVAYFKSVKLLTMSPFGGVSESTYIAFKRR